MGLKNESRLQKEAKVKTTHDELENASLVIVASQKGMTVEQATILRREMRQMNANFKVLKNTLVKIAIKDTKLSSLCEYLSGPTALAYSKDPIAAAKVMVKFATDFKELSILGGILDGKLLKEPDIKNLATLPSLDELRGKIIGIITAPLSKIARTIKEPAAQLARLASAYGSKE